SSNSGDNHSFVLARFTQDGALDPTFGQNGTGIVVARPPRPPGVFIAWVGGASLLTLSADKIIVAGAIGEGFPDGPNGHYAVAQFDADGHLDRSFAGPDGLRPDILLPGWAVSPVPFDIQVHSGLVVQPDGEIVLVGKVQDALGGLVRFQSDGSVDASTE